jgi:hypothetical protein
VASAVAIDEGGKMSRSPVAERPLSSRSRGLALLRSFASRLIVAASDTNLVMVLIVFTAICPLALNVHTVVPDASLAMRQIGPHP